MGMDSENQSRPRWWQIVLVGRNPKRTLLRIVGLVVLCLVTYKFALLPIRVQGVSMLPTYAENGVNCVNRLAYRFHEPQRGDVVAIRLRAGEHIMFMKRIVGLPGEMVGFHEGHVVVNGQVLDEPYLKRVSDWERPAEKVQADEYFVVGDNRSMLQTEHEFGCAKRSQIVGRVML